MPDTGILEFVSRRAEMVRRISLSKDPRSLKIHPLSKQVFRSSPSASFVESIREDGVLEPIITTTDDVIISGHKRTEAAIAVGIKEVPVIQDSEFDDDMLAERAVIVCNKERHELTNEEKGRAYAALKKIETKLARRRKQLGNKRANTPLTEDSTPGTTIPQKGDGSADPTRPQKGDGSAYHTVPQKKGRSGRASYEAAAALRQDEKTAEKRAEVVREIDAAEQNGQTDRAEMLRKKLEKSVVAAHQEIKKPPATNDKPKRRKPPQNDWYKHADGMMKTCDKMLFRIQSLRDELGRNKQMDLFQTQLGEARGTLWKMTHPNVK